MTKRLTLLTLAFVLAGCHRSEPIPQAPQAVQTQRMRSDPSAHAGALRFSAVVEADARAPLSFRIPGYVIALKQTRGEDGRMRELAEGDRVTRGTVLVRIRSTEYEERLRQAGSQAAAIEALAQKATLDFDRATRLYASQSLTKADFDTAQAQHDATQGQMKAARAATQPTLVARPQGTARLVVAARARAAQTGPARGAPTAAQVQKVARAPPTARTK